MTPEGRLLAWTIAFAKSRGVLSIRLSFARGIAAGWPDAMFLLPQGRVLFIEFKRPGAKPSPLQEHRLETLRELGFNAIWADSRDTARSAILQAMGTATLPE